VETGFLTQETVGGKLPRQPLADHGFHLLVDVRVVAIPAGAVGAMEFLAQHPGAFAGCLPCRLEAFCHEVRRGLHGILSRGGTGNGTFSGFLPVRNGDIGNGEVFGQKPGVCCLPKISACTLSRLRDWGLPFFRFRFKDESVGSPLTLH
jgi:hypothetical protein